MTKELVVQPENLLAPGEITFHPIPLNTYQKTVRDVVGEFTREEFLHMFRDMWIVREFETMLNSIKVTNQYEGMEYFHPGPAHLGIGQEAGYVGQAYNLTIEDFTFGSHRSHGEILAKGMSSIEKLSDEKLTDIMSNFFGGETYNVVLAHTQYSSNVKDIAREFLLYGMVAETWGRQTGFNRGLGGSMHAFFTPFGIYPNNAIVGGSAPISTGAALFKRVMEKDGIVVCNIGDGALGCGPVYEAMNFSTMDQLTKLWDEEHRGGLPVIYNIWNNSYGMGGQTAGETMGYQEAARLGAGLNPAEMHAERIDGLNPLAVIDAYRRKMQIIKERQGPVLLDIVTYRTSGHSPSDSGSYRTKEEIEMWEKRDSIKTFGAQLVDAGVATEDELSSIEKQVREDIKWAVSLGRDEKISPRIDLAGNPDAIADMMFTDLQIPSMDPSLKPDVLQPYDENERVKKIARKVRSAFEDGKPVSKNRTYQIRDAVFEAVMQKFYQDATFVAYGEDNRDWGGAFGCYTGITEAIPYHRFFNAPISEAAIVGTAVGYAMTGGRVCCELMYSDFMGRAGDEIFNQMAKWQAMSGDVLKMPVTLRMSVGSKYGAQHSQDWSALCTHIPGLKIVFPATPYDTLGLLNTALNGTDPVVFLESQRIYDMGEMFQPSVPVEYYEIPFGEPDVKRAGTDITILSVGATLYRAVEAANRLQKEFGISAELIDARSLVPFNYEQVIESVKKTGKILVTGDACERGSHLKDFAQNITELAFDYLDAPPVVVGAKNWITPAHELEEYFFPQASTMLDAINERIMPLPGYTPTSNQTEMHQIENYKRGV